MMISRGEVDAFSERTTQEAVSVSARLSHYHVGCSHHSASFPDYGLWVYMWLEFGVWIPCSNLHPPWCHARGKSHHDGTPSNALLFLLRLRVQSPDMAARLSVVYFQIR